MDMVLAIAAVVAAFCALGVAVFVVFDVRGSLSRTRLPLPRPYGRLDLDAEIKALEEALEAEETSS